jgi:hypothetical protein
MLRFSRSEILRSEKAPAIVDGTAAKSWLAGMAQPATLENLVEITQVLHALGALGAEDATVLPAQRKFAIADRIRGVLLPILTGGANDDRFKVLPLDDDAGRYFWTAVEATEALRDCYAWLVSQLPKTTTAVDEIDTVSPDGSPPPASGMAVVSGVGALHRALDVDAQMMTCIQRARWAVPVRLWERHCVLGQLVRDLECQDVEVADVQRLSATKTCRAAFVFPVMIALADPASRSGAEFEVARMAAQRWSAKMGFRLERRVDGGSAPERPVANPGPTVMLGSFVLRFDTQSAMHSIDKRLDALAEGRTPREVGIGDMLRAPAARELLLALKQRWGSKSPPDIDSPDRVWRVTANVGKPVTAMVGMPTREAIANRSSLGQGLRGAQSPYSYQGLKEGAITQPREQIDRSRIDQLLESAESWTLAAESSDAVRCIRKHARPRLGLQRLVGLRLGGPEHEHAAPFLLGWVEALQGSTTTVDDEIRHSSAHTVRVRLAPGLPQLLFATIDDVEVDSAFLLVPGSAARNAAGRAVPFVPMLSDSGLSEDLFVEDDDGWEAVRASPRDYGLVLPHASFRPQRLVKAVRQGAMAMLRLEELMMRGSDFDLVRFVPM